MKTRRTFIATTMVSLIVAGLLAIHVLAGAATTNTATAAGGEDCARIEAKGTGAMTVSEVRVNGVAKTTGFTVVRTGSQVVISFNPRLAANDTVQVFLNTANKGEFNATLTLSNSRGSCR